MLGYIQYEEGHFRPELEQMQLSGCSFAGLRMGRSAHPYRPIQLARARRSAGKLAELGVRRAVFPMDFPYTTVFLRQGIYPVDLLPLRKELAPALVCRRLKAMDLAPTRAVIAIVCDRVSREVAESTRLLASRYRYVMLAVQAGGEELARTLRRECGISLLLNPSVEQIDRADALLLYTPRGDLSCENSVFYALYPGGEASRGRLPLRLPQALAAQAGSNCDREQLAAALYTLGVVTPETILAEIPC